MKRLATLLLLAFALSIVCETAAYAQYPTNPYYGRRERRTNWWWWWRPPQPEPEPDPEPDPDPIPDPEPDPDPVPDPEPDPVPIPDGDALLVDISGETTSSIGYQRVRSKRGSRSGRAVPSTFYVPNYYQNPSGHRDAKDGLRKDSEAALASAIVWAVEGDRASADTAIDIIMDWTRCGSVSQSADSPLSFAYHYTGQVVAADLVLERMTPTQITTYRQWLRDVATQALPRLLSRENNWSNWGLSLKTAIGAFNSDANMLDECWQEYTFSIGDQLNSKSQFRYEIGRDGSGGEEPTGAFRYKGLSYSAFALNGLAFSGLLLERHGYPGALDWEASGGRSLPKASRQIAAWYRYEFVDRNGEPWPGSQNPQRDWSRFNVAEAFQARRHDPNTFVVISQNRDDLISYNAPTFWTFLYAVED